MRRTIISIIILVVALALVVAGIYVLLSSSEKAPPVDTSHIGFLIK